MKIKKGRRPPAEEETLIPKHSGRMLGKPEIDTRPWRLSGTETEKPAVAMGMRRRLVSRR